MDVETLLTLAQNAVDVGNVKAAFNFYDIAHQNYPNNPDVLEAYADVMIHCAHDNERAMQMLRHAIEVNPSEGYVKYLNLAQLSSGEEAMQLYTQAYLLIKAEISQTRKKKALAALRQEASECACSMAELYLTDLCEAENAEQLCEAAIQEAKKQCKESVEVWMLEGSLRLSQEMPSEALESLKEAVRLTHKLGEDKQPSYDSKIELGKLLMQVSQKLAFTYLREILQLDDCNSYVWFLLGETARLRKKYNDAARILAHARNVAIITKAGDEAVTLIDGAIRALCDEIGEEAVSKIPNIGTPTPLDELDENTDTELSEDVDDEPEWLAEENECPDIEA